MVPLTGGSAGVIQEETYFYVCWCKFFGFFDYPQEGFTIIKLIYNTIKLGIDALLYIFDGSKDNPII